MLYADMVRICDAQDEIIKAQSDIIDSLFMKLAQAIETEELFAIPEIDKMQEVVEMRKSIGEEILEEVKNEQIR